MEFVSLQALRGIAALGVMLFHLLPFEAKYLPGGSIVPSAFSAGRASVDLFFVLSGFLAVWTTAGATGAGAARKFLLRRLTRIYPTYWLYCLPLVVAAVAIPAGARGAELVPSLLLIPNAAPPLLLVAWTLEFEIYFYLAFALLIWAGFGRRRTMLALAALGAFAVVGRLLLAPTRSQAVLDAVLSPLVLEFLAGCAAGFLCTGALRRSTAIIAGTVGLGIVVAGLAWSETLFALPWLRVAVFGVGIALLLVGCCREDRAVRRVLPRLLVRIGDVSYSLYLSHLFTIGIIGHVLARLAPSVRLLATPAGHAAALCAAVVASVLVAEASYRWIERPMLRVSRFLATPTRLPQAVPAA